MPRSPTRISSVKPKAVARLTPAPARACCRPLFSRLPATVGRPWRGPDRALGGHTSAAATGCRPHPGCSWPRTVAPSSLESPKRSGTVPWPPHRTPGFPPQAMAEAPCLPSGAGAPRASRPLDTRLPSAARIGSGCPSPRPPYPSATRSVAATGGVAESGPRGHALSDMPPSTPLAYPALAKPPQMGFPPWHHIHLRYPYHFYGITQMDRYYIDLLFYHIRLRCFVVIEL